MNIPLADTDSGLRSILRLLVHSFCPWRNRFPLRSRPFTFTGMTALVRIPRRLFFTSDGILTPRTSLPADSSGVNGPEG